MQKHPETYHLLTQKVGLEEDMEYHRLKDPENVYGESLRPLAQRNIKRFIALIYLLVKDWGEKFDLIIGPGDSGIGPAKVVEMIYSHLGINPPVTLALPIIRWEPKWLEYHGQHADPFDNTVFLPKIEEVIKDVQEITNVLVVDDEITNGITARTSIELLSIALKNTGREDKFKITLVAEDQNFSGKDFLDEYDCDFFNFSVETDGINNILSYAVPWEIEKQIRSYFNDREIGSKVFFNSLLGLPSKEFERFEEYILEEPFFTNKYIDQLMEKVLDFKALQNEFRMLVVKWIEDTIKELRP